MEFIKKIKDVNCSEWFEVCMKFIITLLISMACSIVALITIGVLIRWLDGVLGIHFPEWISIVGTVVSGLFGVIGGIYSSQYQMRLKEINETNYIIDSIKTSLKSEIKMNSEILAHNKDNHNDEFELNQWQNLRYEIIKLARISEYADLSRQISDLYMWMEYTNKLIHIEPNIIKESRIRLYSKISLTMNNALIGISKL